MSRFAMLLLAALLIAYALATPGDMVWRRIRRPRVYVSMLY